jgi:hypothetical protein
MKQYRFENYNTRTFNIQDLLYSFSLVPAICDAQVLVAESHAWELD